MAVASVDMRQQIRSVSKLEKKGQKMLHKYV